MGSRRAQYRKWEVLTILSAPLYENLTCYHALKLQNRITALIFTENTHTPCPIEGIGISRGRGSL